MKHADFKADKQDQMNTSETNQSARDSNENKFLLTIDLLMLGLISLNISWIFFDALFESKSFQDIIQWISPAFHSFYVPIHEDFLKYDLVFIALYLLEFCFRWILAIQHKHYYKWYIFPISHWYDLLGCIPVGSFHLLRVLRVIIIIRRLHELGILNWQNTILFQYYKKYLSIASEEISDRVVVEILDGVSRELKLGSPILQQIIDKAVKPQQEHISDIISQNISHTIHKAYDIRKSEIRKAIQHLVQQAAHRSKDLALLKSMPLFGGHATQLLENTVSDMVYAITDQIIDYFRSDLSTELIDETIEVLLESLSKPNSEANHLVQEVLLDTIEVIKAKVLIQQWKIDHDPASPTDI